MLDLMVQLDGQTVPLKDCRWVRFTADGCATGSTLPVTELGTIADAQSAQRDLTPLKRDRDRENRQGVTYELLTRQQWDERAMPCFMGTCQHHAATAP